jgi:pimeloyl-ACP methyl ester carboxylesterase
MARSIIYATTPFGEIAYSEQGEGPAALFVHGVFLNGHLWRHVIDRVADIRRCIAVDLLAHGATTGSADQDLSFTAQAEMLEAFCAALRLDQVDLVANDSGGGIAQIFAAHHPERIRSLTLTNCDTHDNWPPEPFRPVVAAAAQGNLGELGRRALADVQFARLFFALAYEHPEKITEETFRTYLEPVFGTPEAARRIERFVAAQDCRQTVAIEGLLRRLQAPTLIVWGADDIFFDVKWAYWLRDTVPGCRKVIELDGARLFFPEERPDALATALREHWQSRAESPIRRQA